VVELVVTRLPPPTAVTAGSAAGVLTLGTKVELVPPLK